jgi:hypothetical protein
MIGNPRLHRQVREGACKLPTKLLTMHHLLKAIEPGVLGYGLKGI